MTEILIALITGGLALIGSAIGVFSGIKTGQKVTEVKLEELTREVREHNHFAKRIPVVEALTTEKRCRKAVCSSQFCAHLSAGNPVRRTISLKHTTGDFLRKKFRWGHIITAMPQRKRKPGNKRHFSCNASGENSFPCRATGMSKKKASRHSAAAP